MSLLKLTVEGNTPAELVAALLSAASTFGAAQGFVINKAGSLETSGDDAKTKKETATSDEPLPEEPAGEAADTSTPKGRRGGRNKPAETKEPEEDASATKGGRRSRSTKKEELVNDNEEQAALRAQLIVDLQDLADVEEAHGQVAEALQRVGAKSVNEVASATLGDFNEDIQKILKRTVKDVKVLSAGDIAQLETDLTDLKDIIDNPGEGKQDDADDVRDSLLDAWEKAGVKTTDAVILRNVKKLNSDTVEDFRNVVDQLLAKYFN